MECKETQIRKKFHLSFYYYFDGIQFYVCMNKKKYRRVKKQLLLQEKSINAERISF